MAGAFQAMTAALYRRIEASEKFAADVAHELKNPLTAARSTAESLGYAKTDEQRDHLVEQIQMRAEAPQPADHRRLQRLPPRRRAGAQGDARHRRDDDAAQRSRPSSATSSASDSRAHRCSSSRRSPAAGAYFIVGDEGRLGQVLTNLLDNAISFSPEGGVVTLRARTSGPFVEILVEDEGPGIPTDRLDMI